MSYQQPYINYAQYYNQQAPPQPQWNAAQARPGWHDPRAPQQQQQQFQVPTPSTSQYNLNQYGAMPSASSAQPHVPQPQWGVKYNQQQAQQQQQQYQQQYQQPHELKPALPPRPQSSTGRVDSPVATYQLQAPIWPARPSDNQHVGTASQTPSEPWGNHYVQQSSQSEAPPPPPRPAEYSNQASSNTSSYTYDYYAQQPPSHHYEPSTNPDWSHASAGQRHSIAEADGRSYGSASGSQNQALVSPIDPMSKSWTQLADNTTAAPLSQTTTYDHYQPVQTPLQGDPNFASHLPPQAASALGYGAPSDWEHFAPNSDAVSPELSYSTPTESKPQPNFEDGVKEQTVRQPSDRMISDTQVEQNRRQSHNTAGSRHGSTSSDGLGQGIQRTGTIDSVIHAWNAPLRPRKESLRKTSITGSPSLQSPFPAQQQAHLQDIRAETPTPQSSVTPLNDPYGDLEPQFRASLTRFVAMLRKEAAADTDNDKFKIFDNFVQKETRLRAVLYDIDLAPINSGSAVRGSSQKPDKAPQRNEAHLEEERPGSAAANVLGNVQPQAMALQSQDIPERVATPPKLSPKLHESPQSKEDSFVMVDRERSEDSTAYSPGGRPIVRRPINVNTQIDPVSTPAINDSVAPYKDQVSSSPSDNAPQVVGEDYASTVPESPALAAPIVFASLKSEMSPQLRLAATSNGPLPMPVKFEPSRPAYTPFRYAEGSQIPSNAPNVDKAPDQDYISKRSTYDSSRLMAHDSNPSPSSIERVTSPTAVKRMQEDTFLGLIRSHSTARPKSRSMNIPESIRPGTTPPMSQTRSDPIRDAVQALRSGLPTSDLEKSHTGKVTQLRRSIEAFVDNFSFIRETVIPWDRDNRLVRKTLDEERHKRQEESEMRLDELFDDREIAYDELKGMEADFKLAEAERRYEEDKQELDSFTTSVYNVVTSRLQHDIDELSRDYVVAIDLLDLDSDPASRVLISNTNRSAISDVMETVLQLFEKLNIRYLKLAEARFERERRRKRLELTVLYTNGDSEGTKKLEKEFSTAEKLQILHEARDKDQRATKLMDTFERATVRALGDNQAFLDDLFAKVRRLNDVLPADGAWRQNATGPVYGDEGARDTLASAQAVVNFVLADSQAILTTSNAADKILNDADYAVSVAEAKAANAEDTTHSKLKTDKEKEDGKLLEEMNIRMDSILKSPSDLTTLIQDIVVRIGNDVEHPDRMKKALEAAKLRNAGKES